SIRREVGFRDCDSLKLFSSDVLDLFRLQLVARRQPHHQPTTRINRTAARREQSFALKLIDAFSVGGKENVKRRAVFDLFDKVSGGAETDDQSNPSDAGKAWTNLGEGIGQISG